MPVLCEAISVVIRSDRALEVFGSFDAFREIVPNETLCADDEIIRVGFMTPDDVQGFVGSLEERGLRYLRNGEAVDMVVVDQLRGPAVSCVWIEFGHVHFSGKQVASARLAGGKSSQIFTPAGWVFEGSLSSTFGFVPQGAEEKSMKFLRQENGLDVYLNLLTGREVYIGRISGRDYG